MVWNVQDQKQICCAMITSLNYEFAPNSMTTICFILISNTIKAWPESSPRNRTNLEQFPWYSSTAWVSEEEYVTLIVWDVQEQKQIHWALITSLNCDLAQNSMTTFRHPTTNSPDLCPCAFYFSIKLKLRIKGKTSILLKRSNDNWGIFNEASKI